MRRLARDGGMTLSSAPLSTMKRRPLTLPHTKNMRLRAFGPAELVTITRWLWHFPTSCMGSGSGWHVCQRWHGTNKAQDHLWQQRLQLLLQLHNSKHSSRNSCCRTRTVCARGEMLTDVDSDGVLTDVREIDGCAEHDSIIWSATAAICVRVLVSGNAASTVWTTDGIFSKNISLKKANSTWSLPTNRRIHCRN